MGLFTSPRRSSQGHEHTERSSTAHAAKGRISIRSVLSMKDAPRRRSLPSPLGKSKSLTVIVPPTESAKPATPARFIATSHKLGNGAYGAVLLGRDVCTSAPVAIKFIPDGRMRTSSLEREVSMLQRLSEANHPALVKFHGHVRPEAIQAGEVRAEGTLPLVKPHTTCHALVMEAARGGELFDHVVKCEGLKEAEAGPLMAQLCDAVRTAHILGISHRDLKLENVLLVRKKNAPVPSGGKLAEESAIKLIDWGLAHQHTLLPDGSVVPEMLHSRCGSRSYMAPEVSNRDISGTVGYDGFAADTWSLGVCLFAMHLAFFPFEQANPELDWRARRVVDAQRQGKSTMATILSFYPQKAPNGGLSEPLIALLDRMLIFDPSKRATLTEVLCSEWLAPHVPAAAYHASIAQTIRLAAREFTSRSTSTSSEGPPTPRAPDEEVVVTRSVESGAAAAAAAAASAVRLATDRAHLSRHDSSSTAHTASSVATSTVSSVLHTLAPTAMADSGWLPRVRAGGDGATHGQRSSQTQPALLLPPPPSPLPVHAQHVVAGGSQLRAPASIGQLSPGKHTRYAGGLEHDKDVMDTSERLAALLGKSCKLNTDGSPRRPYGRMAA